MTKLIIEPHYLGSLEYFVLLSRFKEVQLEVCQHFIKQTFKNRFTILTAQGTQSLVIPVQFDNRTPTKDVKVDHSQSWVREHWGAVYSAYGKSPFFEFFSDYFRSVWEKRYNYLLDLDMDFMTICLDLLQIEITFEQTSTYQPEVEKSVLDCRETIQPKIAFSNRNIYTPNPYSQNFGNEFVPNLSILDLLLSQGSAAADTLKKSDGKGTEHF